MSGKMKPIARDIRLITNKIILILLKVGYSAWISRGLVAIVYPL